jgi:hypothetical protein
MSLRRGVRVAGATLLFLSLVPAMVVLARVEMSAGIRYVSATGTADECSAKAKASLEAYLPGATESSPGSGEWMALGQNVVTGAPSSAATVRCYPLPKGYVATFICAVQLPANPFGAGPLCLDIAHKFYGGAITPLAAMPTPTPVPSGCATTSLVGTWVSDADPKLTLTMDLAGGLTDSDGVSGNWNLDGTSATLTYYGTHTLTLSADGKHIRGSGYNFTRKC